MVTRQGHTQLPLTMQEAYRKSAQALNVIGAKITNEDEKPGRIEAKRGMSFTSWGEKVVVKLSGVDKAVYVLVTSSSSWPMTVVDWAMNQQNVGPFPDWMNR